MERASSSGSDRDGEDEVEVVVEEELEPEDVEAKAVDDEAEERPAEEEATAEPPEGGGGYGRTARSCCVPLRLDALLLLVAQALQEDGKRGGALGAVRLDLCAADWARVVRAQPLRET